MFCSANKSEIQVRFAVENKQDAMENNHDDPDATVIKLEADKKINDDDKIESIENVDRSLNTLKGTTTLTYSYDDDDTIYSSQMFEISTAL